MPRRSCGAAVRLSWTRRLGASWRSSLSTANTRRCCRRARGRQNWTAPIRLAPSVAREVAGRQGQEAARLAGQARSALQQRGVVGLAREMINYVQWQLMQRGQ